MAFVLPTTEIVAARLGDQWCLLVEVVGMMLGMTLAAVHSGTAVLCRLPAGLWMMWCYYDYN